MIAKRSCLATLSLFVLFGCKTASDASRPLSDSELDGHLQSTPDYMSEGFTIKVESGAAGQEQPDSDTMLVLEDGSGSVVSRAPYSPEGFALDREVLADGTVIYKWPKSTEVINRDYNRLGELMTEYSNLVGTLLKRDAKGPGEVAWSQWIRREQGREVEAARRSALQKEMRRKQQTGQFELSNVTNAWCNANVNQLVDRLVPKGSTYRQYGNCGEGGQIGACLAKRAGFKENEIRICLSANDHFFAMVYRGVENGVDHRWCILDRWPLIGNFSCGVDIDNSARQITQKGKLVNQEWFKRAGCTTLDQYLVDPWTSLYTPVGRY